MDDFTEVARTGDLAVGRMKKVVVHGHELLLARTAAGFFCAEDRCPHLGGDLSLGTLSGAVVTCPDHLSEFDLATGAVLLGPAERPLTVVRLVAGAGGLAPQE